MNEWLIDDSFNSLRNKWPQIEDDMAEDILELTDESKKIGFDEGYILARMDLAVKNSEIAKLEAEVSRLKSKYERAE